MLYTSVTYTHTEWERQKTAGNNSQQWWRLQNNIDYFKWNGNKYVGFCEMFHSIYPSISFSDLRNQDKVWQWIRIWWCKTVDNSTIYMEIDGLVKYGPSWFFFRLTLMSTLRLQALGRNWIRSKFDRVDFSFI